MTSVLILILLTLWLAITVFCGVAGFYLGRRYKPKQEQKPRAAPESTEEEKRRALRRQKELENMISYDGEMQEDIVVE